MGKKVEKQCVNRDCERVSRKRKHKKCPECGADLKEGKIHQHQKKK